MKIKKQQSQWQKFTVKEETIMFKKMNLQIFAEGANGNNGEGSGNDGGNSGDGNGIQNQNTNNNSNNGSTNDGGQNNSNNQQQNPAETFNKEDYLKELGVKDEDAFKQYIANKKKEEEQNLTDLQKVQRTLDATNKELAKEKRARMQAEAKLQAIKDGAKPELVDDLVAVAMTKVSRDKTVEQVLAEMKKDVSRSFYYNTSNNGDSGQQNNQQQNQRFTRGNGTNGNNQNQNNPQNNNNQNTNNPESGGLAARLFARKNMGKTNNNQGNK